MENPFNERAYVFYVSMAKHMYDLGNYQYCSEVGKNHDLKYTLLALRVSDKEDNDRFIYGGSCVPSRCTADEIREGFQTQMETLYKGTFDHSEGLTVTFPDSEDPSINVGTIAAIVVIAVLVVLVIIGTVIDRTSILNLSCPPPNPNIGDENPQRMED